MWSSSTDSLRGVYIPERNSTRRSRKRSSQHSTRARTARCDRVSDVRVSESRRPHRVAGRERNHVLFSRLRADRDKEGSCLVKHVCIKSSDRTWQPAAVMQERKGRDARP